MAARNRPDDPNDPAGRKRRPAGSHLVGAIVAVAFLAIGASAWFIHWLSRDAELDCGALGNARAGEICRGLEAGLEFEWFGHAIVSPGYRVTFAGARATYCNLAIDADDTAALQELIAAEDWRLQNGGDFLLRLATRRDRYGTPEAETSIFNPTHPDYVLKDGCLR